MDRLIALLTDFGTSDAYVGIMKAVMQRIYPPARFIDITHDITPQDIQQGALALLSAYRYFSPRTIFLVVVDPGVGSQRRPLAVQAGDYLFVAPDNGVLSYVLAETQVLSAVELTNPAYQITPVSQTFHGRDIFAPAAAYLATGVPVHAFGPEVPQPEMLPAPHLHIDQTAVTGQVTRIDRFGNIITSIGQMRWLAPDQLEIAPRFGSHADLPGSISASGVTIRLQGYTLSSIRRAYSEVQPGDLLALIDSAGFLEIAANQGNAASILGVSPGVTVTLQIG